MIQCVYSVRDRKALSFGPLMFFVNDEIARRGAADLMAAGGSDPVHMYPGDFELFRVGAFDTESGVIDPVVPPVSVCSFDAIWEK